MKHFFDTEFKARQFMSELPKGSFSYYHESICRHWVTVYSQHDPLGQYARMVG